MDKALATFRRWLWHLAVATVILVPSFRDVDYKSYAVSIGFFLLLLLESLRIFRKPEFSFSPLELYLALYVGWTCLSYFWSPVDLAASEYLGRFLPCVGVFWLIRQRPEESQEPASLWVWMGLAFLTALYGSLQKMGLDFVTLYAENGSSARIFATFGNPNLYAAFLVLTMPVLLSVSPWKRNPWIRVFQILFPVLLFTALVLTQSRAGYIGFFVEMILAGYFIGTRAWRDTEWRWATATFALLVLLGGVFLARQAGSRPTERMEVWKGAVWMIMEKPLRGWGVGQFSLHFQPYMTEALAQQTQKDNTFAEHAHNEILETGVELGLVGLVAAGFFWLQLVGRAWRSIIQWKDGGLEQVFPMAGPGLGLIGVGITNLFDYNCRLPGIAFFLWMSAGLLANRVFPPDRIRWKAPLGVLLGLFLAACAAFGLVQETRLLAAILSENSQNDFLKAVPADLSAELRRLLRAVRDQPDNAENYHELGNLFAKSGNLQEAQKAFEKEAVLNPRSTGAYLNLGNIYLLTSGKDPSRIDLAQKCYEKSIQLDPNSVDGHFNLAYVYFLQRDLKSALRELDEVLKIDPQNAKALSLKRQILP